MTKTATSSHATPTPTTAEPVVDFTQPAGEPALVAPDSVSWRIFKNPVALYIGGIAAVLLELAEPRVRSGVWDHTTFRVDPISRMKRTGLAAMVTVYGAHSVAEEMIKGITKMHARVRGETPDGRSYKALEPELMNWVQVTASYGFLQAYHRFVAPLSDADRDRFYAEAETGARLYGAPGAPKSEEEQRVLFEAMLPQLEPSSIVLEFLEIMHRTRPLPWAIQPLQPLYLRAAVSLLPANVLDRLQLRGRERLALWQRTLVRQSGKLADRIVLREAPPAQACQRLGLRSDYLYK
jgi:uncharacterized protein (DUF2236 family)